MAKVSAKNAIILIKGYNLSTYATSMEADTNMNPIDVTGFTDESKNFIPGQKEAKILVDMLYDSTALKSHAALKSLGTGVVTVLPEGSTLGNPSISMPFMQANYSPKGDPGSAIAVGTINFIDYGNNAGIDYGNVLAHTTTTDTYTGTEWDDATNASVTKACAGTLQVWTPTQSSTDTYTFTIEHSTTTTSSDYVTLLTFDANGATRTAERKTVTSGTINRYRRAVATKLANAYGDVGFTITFWHE
jgi:hypothetical protein